MPALTHRAFGAQTLAASFTDGSPLLYLTPYPLPSDQPARGGVPVLFPQFADSGPQPKHGWARNRIWQLQEELQQDDMYRVRYQLAIQAGSVPDWPHAATLQLQSIQSCRSTEIELTIRNDGDTSFSWSGGLHPYFHIDSLATAVLRGLHGAQVYDRYAPQRRIETDDTVRWTGEALERLYDTAAPLLLDTGTQQLQLKMSGFTQWMVWNPGEHGARQLADLPDVDWASFICIEPVIVEPCATILPGASFCGRLTVTQQAGASG